MMDQGVGMAAWAVQGLGRDHLRPRQKKYILSMVKCFKIRAKIKRGTEPILFLLK